ncbi:pancreatic lipase-related protein 3-like [Sipha flava]|uniref:Pancreatic lipase-related protein 3-like n=1 Tax=Sipha flava TaxID=143950 RepID=A0A8B8GC20_9HEMI|nr:pancreatic lipase-related protein 3-like [Sipha flava]
MVPKYINEFCMGLNFYYWTLESGLGEDDQKKTFAYKINLDNLSLIKNVWKIDKQLIVVTHGYISMYDDQGAYSIKNTYAFNYPDQYNIITLGWIVEYHQFLDVLRDCEHVGHALSHFLIKLVKLKLIMPSNIHMIGHNLGAHVLGACGANFYELTDMKIGRITGLNPKGPISIYPWEKWNYLKKTLQKDDAEFVDLIHTAKAKIFPSTTGHVVFYPNGGKTCQPGCEYEIDDYNYDLLNKKKISELFCSDARSYEFYKDSIIYKSAFVSELYNPKTKILIKYENKPVKSNRMGHYVNKEKHGNFYLNTEEKSPFDFQWYIPRG